MNTSISIIIKAAAKNAVKGTTFEVKGHKTQTNLEISFEKKDRASIDFPSSLAEDLAALGFTAEPIGPITVIVSDAVALGKLHNRSVAAFNRIGVVVPELDWDAEGGLLEFTVKDGTVLDLPAMVDIISRMVFRSTTKFTSTRHPLSLFDLKQTTGLVGDAKDGLGDAQKTLDWFSVKELTILEEEKKIRAEAKAKTAAKKKAEAEAAAAIKAEEKKAAKAEAKTAAKAEEKTPKPKKEKKGVSSDPNE